MHNADSWSFPCVEVVEKETHSSQDETVTKQRENEFIAQQIALTNELEILKCEYSEKLNLVNQILTKFENPMLVFDAELAQILQDIIKKIVKNIIHKEIKKTPNLLNGMIEEIEKLIHQENGLVTVSLSETDYKRFVFDNKLPNASIHINSKLRGGDIIVKSNFTEVRAILNARLDRIIKDNS